MNMIEPCCIQKQLPRLIQEKPEGVFYSNGDWGIEKLMWAAAWLVDSPAVTVLLAREVDLAVCRYLLQCLQRDWTSAVVLITTEDCVDLVANELSGYEDRVLYQYRPSLGVQMYVRVGESQQLVVSGPMYARAANLFSQYHYMWGKKTDGYYDVVGPVRALFAGKPQTAGKCEAIVKFLKDRKEV